jgi:invasion protein IalB
MCATPALWALAQSATAPSKPTASAPAAVAQAAAPAAAAAPAPVGAEPQSTTATYGDWVLRCLRGTAADPAQRLCEVGQTLEVKGQGVVAQIALGRTGGTKEPVRMTVVLPPNVMLPSVVRVGLGETDQSAVDLAWQRCLPGGCVAEGEIRDDLLKSWRAQTASGQIRFVSASSKPVNLTFSFRGLGVALDNLAKTVASQ